MMGVTLGVTVGGEAICSNVPSSPFCPCTAPDGLGGNGGNGGNGTSDEGTGTGTAGGVNVSINSIGLPGPTVTIGNFFTGGAGALLGRVLSSERTQGLNDALRFRDRQAQIAEATPVGSSLDRRSQRLADGFRELMITDPELAEDIGIGAGIATGALAVLPLVPSLAATCSASCSTVALGVAAGTGLESSDQVIQGNFNGPRLIGSAFIGAAGGAGSLLGRGLTQNMLGAMAGAGGMTFLVNIPSVANGEVDAFDALTNTFQNSLLAPLGTFAGAKASNFLRGRIQFGGLDKLDNFGAAASAASGETAAAITSGVINSGDE